ncbi:phosphoenolpyruvate-protein phosphotransferase [Mediterraneibacter butyricigenes]|uniref:Phosphoenolpyruvate-protein phosphotransferase n=1 Tax=Mediterraneibacter butyricigenes TaxID=2316025 RepID=A0A391P4C9_9FIRM|nr:phosphoenolpyruvate--protein phosphotransferase [Mediterraneibacter butyricigenes]GCA66996.1 phosphoenolpyruvate-protein phosphotransferase [Mediterraneibacter butyricigenes]
MKGIAISSGEAIAKPLVLEEVSFEDMLQIETEDVEQELKRFQVSRNHMKSYFQDLIRQRGASLSEEALAIIKIHLEFLDDPELVENTEELIREDQLCAESALIQNERMICQVLAEVEDEYIKERAADIKDVSKRILLDLQGVKGNDITILDQDVILVAEELEPSQLVAGDARHIKGIVCEKGGRTAHVAIIARSMSIPAVFGIDQAVEKLKEAENIYLHGSQGIVETNKTVEEQKIILDNIARADALRKGLEPFSKQLGKTEDGQHIAIRANIGGIADAKRAKEAGAEGIGLFRTEFLFMEASRMPSEEEQMEVYKSVLETFSDAKVTIRTFDAGGDKQIEYLDMPIETNPFLGCRAIRFCLKRKELLKKQLRALLRASVYGHLRIMYPMISGIGEFREANAVLEEAKQELKDEGIPVADDVEVGLMIEVPSAALCAETLAKEADFFSIGSNDLTQYTMAVDRDNPNVSELFTEFHPAVLKLIKMTVDGAHKHGKHVCICGEFGGNTLATRLLMALGLDELSMNPNSMNRVKKILSLTNREEPEISYTYLTEELSDAEEIKETLKEDLIKKNLGALLDL